MLFDIFLIFCLIPSKLYLHMYIVHINFVLSSQVQSCGLSGQVAVSLRLEVLGKELDDARVAGQLVGIL